MKLFDGRQKKIDEICLGCYRRRHQHHHQVITPGY
jgi:hypothetical protein